MNNINTHARINSKLCGQAIILGKDRAVVELSITEEMLADDRGLVHGGFIFAAADYAAMLAVNHPFVVLGSSEMKFLQPVVSGDLVVLDAVKTEDTGKKKTVAVMAKVEERVVATGIFICFTPEKHVLDRA